MGRGQPLPGYLLNDIGAASDGRPLSWAVGDILVGVGVSITVMIFQA